jgi:hypothetical protein
MISKRKLRQYVDSSVAELSRLMEEPRRDWFIIEIAVSELAMYVEMIRGEEPVKKAKKRKSLA